MLVCLFLSVNVWGQEIVTGGNMEDEGAWMITNKGEPTDEPDYTFNYTEYVPAAGSGGCLRIQGYMEPGGADAQIDSYCFQEITLTGGKTYKFTGAFKDISFDSVYNFWCEVGISAYHPDSNMIGYLVGINTFDGCGRGLDGTFQDDYCKYGGPLYTVSDTIEGDATFYLLFLTGMWDNGTEPREFDVLVDEFSLVEYVEEGIRDMETDGGGSAASLYNYPNPFSEITTITYTVTENSDVELTIYNILGEEIAVLVNEMKTRGTYNVEFDGSGLARNIYFCSLKINNETITRRMIISE
jgi:hypothetical protein